MVLWVRLCLFFSMCMDASTHVHILLLITCYSKCHGHGLSSLFWLVARLLGNHLTYPRTFWHMDCSAGDWTAILLYHLSHNHQQYIKLWRHCFVWLQMQQRTVLNRSDAACYQGCGRPATLQPEGAVKPSFLPWMEITTQVLVMFSFLTCTCFNFSREAHSMSF